MSFSVFQYSIDIFRVTAKQSSFREAARLLNISPSVVSRTIRRLEDDLGFDLFTRAQGVELTAEGKAFQQALNIALLPLEQTIAHLREQNFSKPSVTIGLADSFNYYGSSLLEAIKPLCSHIRLVSSGSSEQLIHWLKNGEVDLIVAPDSHQDEHSLQRLPILEESVKILFPKGILSTETPLTWEAIRFSGLPLIGYSRCQTFEKMIASLAQKENLLLQTRIEVDSNALLLGLISAKQGWAFLYPSSFAAHISDKIDVFDPPTILPKRFLSIGFRNGQYESIARAIQTFMTP